MKPASVKKTRNHLRKLRDAIGADTFKGRRCSNMIEMLDNLPSARSKNPTKIEQRRKLLRALPEQAAEMARL